MSTNTILFIALIIFLPSIIEAQTSKKIDGIVIDRRGSRISFCTITIKGSKDAAMSDSCGAFQLGLPVEEFTIVFNCSATHDFVTFEQRIDPQKFREGDTILFQLQRHRNITNSKCKTSVNKNLQKVKVRY